MSDFGFKAGDKVTGDALNGYVEITAVGETAFLGRHVALTESGETFDFDEDSWTIGPHWRLWLDERWLVVWKGRQGYSNNVYSNRLAGPMEDAVEFYIHISPNGDVEKVIP